MDFNKLADSQAAARKKVRSAKIHCTKACEKAVHTIATTTRPSLIVSCLADLCPIHRALIDKVIDKG